MDERIDEKKRVDNRISTIEEGTKRIKYTIELFQKAAKGENGYYNSYTPIDLVIDINETIRKKLPENREGKLVRESSFEVPIDSLPEECKTVGTQLLTEQIKNAGGVVTGERLIYSLKTCTSEGQFLQCQTTRKRIC